ncbi:MAG: hypothetical protein HC836_42115 [Richelia sp. RM2_1_2]|nr:hypothetical protein [Richelia sp. RM2_1_2]
MEYNGELKEINTKEKAYLLGFLYGDGTITTYKEKTGRIRYWTKISISHNDKIILDTLKSYFKFFKEGSFDYSKYNKNNLKQVSLKLGSKKLFDDLINAGLYPRKSYENKEKLSLPNIANELLSNFVLGFFDADGSIFKMKYRKNLMGVEIVSNSFNFITQLNNLLELNNIFSWKIVEKKPHGKGKQIYYIIKYTKMSEIIKLRNYLYNNHSIALPRKYEMFQNIKLVDKVIDRNISCPHCNSIRTTKNGKRKQRMRMKCCECAKGFTL